jgi:hypothetical protein
VRAEPRASGPRRTTMKVWIGIGALVTMLLLTGCSAQVRSAGTVRGRLIFAGGPAPGAWPVTPGTVRLRGLSDYQVAVDSRGRFEVTTAPGSYRATGTSPTFGSNQYLCHAGPPVVVAAGTTSRVDVVCLVR